MTLEDIYQTLTQLDMISREGHSTPRPPPGHSFKHPKGGRKSGVARKALHRNNTRDDDSVKGPFIPPASYTISWDRARVAEYLAKWHSKGYLILKPENLKWSPFLVARTLKSEGLLGDESALPSATGTLTPSTPGFGTRSSVVDSSRTDSPAANLFDDDDDDDREPAESDVLPVLRRRSKSTKDVASSISSALQSSPSSAGTPRRLTRRQTSSNLATITPKAVHVLRRTRSAAKLSSFEHDEAMIAEDAALAAKLAEEDRPMRQLRSRSNTGLEKRPLSPRASTSSVSPRKRRRVESPAATPARHTRSSGTLPTPRRPGPARRSSLRSVATPIRPRGARKSSRLMHEDTATSPHSRSSPPPTSPSPVPTGADEDESNSVQTHVQPASGETEPRPEPERDRQPMKDEESDTPLTGLTSRHSVGHSDDTVYAAEDVMQAGGAVDKVSPPLAVAVAVVAQPTAEPGVVIKVPIPVPVPVVGGTEDSDADAEGEDDLDAEGEDEDAEGEADVDVDAEGEEEDVDAEGEPDLEGEEEIVVDGGTY